MESAKILKITGIFGILGGVFLLLEIPLWVIPGDAGPISDATVHATYLNDIRNFAFTRIIMDILMYACWMVLFAGVRHLIILADRSYEWLASLTLAAGVVWWSVSLVADGLEGAAVLLSMEPDQDPDSVRDLVYATLLIYNGPIAFAVTGLYLGTVGWAFLASGALARWIGWFSLLSAVLCVLSIPALYGGRVNTYGFFNVAGWGPTIVANIPPLVWIFAVGTALIKKGRNNLYRE